MRGRETSNENKKYYFQEAIKKNGAKKTKKKN